MIFGQTYCHQCHHRWLPLPEESHVSKYLLFHATPDPVLIYKSAFGFQKRHRTLPPTHTLQKQGYTNHWHMFWNISATRNLNFIRKVFLKKGRKKGESRSKSTTGNQGPQGKSHERCLEHIAFRNTFLDLHRSKMLIRKEYWLWSQADPWSSLTPFTDQLCEPGSLWWEVPISSIHKSGIWNLD